MGESPGVKGGGVLTQLVRDVTVEALPLEMPDRLTLDISATEIGDALRVSDLSLPADVTVHGDPENVLVTVSAPRLAAELEAMEAEAAAEAELEAEEGEEAVEGEEPEAGEGEEPAAAEGESPAADDASRAHRGLGVMRLRRRRAPEPSLDLLVAGLGNPGREYERTRHNVGWLVLDELASRHGGTYRGKFSGRLAEVRLGDRRLALLKPETYMNESGRSVAAATRFFKSPLESLVVVHDDVDLDEGRLQVRGGGGLAGHNGLRSLADALGSRRLSPRSDRCRTTRAAATHDPSPTTCCRPFRPRPTSGAS